MYNLHVIDDVLKVMAKQAFRVVVDWFLRSQPIAPSRRNNRQKGLAISKLSNPKPAKSCNLEHGTADRAFENQTPARSSQRTSKPRRLIGLITISGHSSLEGLILLDRLAFFTRRRIKDGDRRLLDYTSQGL
ncbi:hypothetical protein CW354_20435 [Marinicaulis flavus]|uniref:Uncharacterized protein n=1 Tax=Hyphococcus luteus TaxID=2058213 RepID=A0A2S7K0E2_9PROT|nr:hypothetical protein CW354_20435 [Marinicaulis flavus]